MYTDIYTDIYIYIYKYIYIYIYILFFQTLTSVPKEHVHVVQMLCAPTLRDRTSVHAKLDTLRMEMSALNVSFSFYVFMGFLVTTIFF